MYVSLVEEVVISERAFVQASSVLDSLNDFEVMCEELCELRRIVIFRFVSSAIAVWQRDLCAIHERPRFSGALPSAHDAENSLYDRDGKNEDFFHVFVKCGRIIMKDAVDIGFEETHSFGDVEI